MSSIGCEKSTPPPNVFLITLDTTRTDHLGVYGYDKPTSPNLDRLANESIVYERATAPATWTLPSHASLMTGKLPTSHGANYDPKGALRLTKAIEGAPDYGFYRARTIARDERTLAALLKDAGYRTGAVVGGPWLKQIFGLDLGFEDYDDEGITSLNGRSAAEVTNSALEWLDEAAGKPRFLFLNYFDPHGPLMPPERLPLRFLPKSYEQLTGDAKEAAAELAYYDAEISFMDRHLGRLFEGLKQRGLYDNSWIIVTADHGELFGEHGETGHGDTPYREVTDIPLIVKKPGKASGSRSDEPIQLTDILPMVLDGLGLAVPPDLQGESPPAKDHPIVIESKTMPPFSTNGDWLALVDGKKKLVWNSDGNHMLFDLESDPREERNRAREDTAAVQAMSDSMFRYLGGLPTPGPQHEGNVQVDPETEEALRNLGYLE